jgi:hypothetical protein
MKAIKIDKPAVAEAAYLASQPNYGGTPYLNIPNNQIVRMDDWTVFDANHIPVIAICHGAYSYENPKSAQLFCADCVEVDFKVVKVHSSGYTRTFHLDTFKATTSIKKSLDEAIASSRDWEPPEYRFLDILRYVLGCNEEYRLWSTHKLVSTGSVIESTRRMATRLVLQSELPKKKDRQTMYEFWYALYGASLACFA